MIRSPIFPGAKVDSVVYLFSPSYSIGVYANRFDGTSVFLESVSATDYGQATLLSASINGLPHIFYTNAVKSYAKGTITTKTSSKQIQNWM